VTISDESTIYLDRVTAKETVKRIITSSASEVSLQIFGNKEYKKWSIEWAYPDFTEHTDVSKTFTKGTTEWIDYYEYWTQEEHSGYGSGSSTEYKWKTYTLIVDGVTVIVNGVTTVIDDRSYPIISQTIAIDGISYIITYSRVEI
jgi:hypothetical protein